MTCPYCQSPVAPARVKAGFDYCLTCAESIVRAKQALYVSDPDGNVHIEPRYDVSRRLSAFAPGRDVHPIDDQPED